MHVVTEHKDELFNRSIMSIVAIKASLEWRLLAFLSVMVATKHGISK